MAIFKKIGGLKIYDLILINAPVRYRGGAKRGMLRLRGQRAEAEMSTNQPNIAGIQRAVANSLHQHWKLYLAEGIILLVLGTAAIMVPPLATLAVTIVLGWLFLISGVVGLFHDSCCGRRRASGGRSFAVVGDRRGVLLLGGRSGRTVADARADRLLRRRGRRIDHLRARARRNCPGNGAGCCSAALIDLILGPLSSPGLPGPRLWALGLLVGINMIFGGWALILLSLAARKAAGA